MMTLIGLMLIDTVKNVNKKIRVDQDDSITAIHFPRKK